MFYFRGRLQLGNLVVFTRCFRNFWLLIFSFFTWLAILAFLNLLRIRLFLFTLIIATVLTFLLSNGFKFYRLFRRTARFWFIIFLEGLRIVLKNEFIYSIQNSILKFNQIVCIQVINFIWKFFLLGVIQELVKCGTQIRNQVIIWIR